MSKRSVFPKLPIAVLVAIITTIGVIIAALCSSPVLITFINNQVKTPELTPAQVNACDFSVDEISLGKSIIETLQPVTVSVRISNPKGLSILYNWSSVYGDMQPGLNSTSSQSIYTAPTKPGEDTITVNVSAPGCSIDKKKQITIVGNISPAVNVPSSTQVAVATEMLQQLPTSTAMQTIYDCPIYQETGVGITIQIHLSIPAGEIAFINTTRFDDKDGGVFVTVTGPYDGYHYLHDGAVCSGIPANANYQPIREQRRQVQNGRTWDIALP